MVFHLLGQHLSILIRVEHDEGFTEASGEGPRGLSDADLSSGHLGGVSVDEVVAGLIRGQLAHWGHDACSITGQEDQVLGVSTYGGDLGIGDGLKRITHTGVLSDAAVTVVHISVDVIRHILKYGVPLDGVEDIGLGLRAQVDGLGIAAAFHVVHTLVGPHVLVISEHETTGVSAQGGLSSSTESEEKGKVSLLTFSAGSVEAEGAEFRGADVVDDSEDSLLHLTGIHGAEHKRLPLLEVQVDRYVILHSGGVRVSGEFTSVQDGPVDLSAEIIFDLLRSRSDEHVLHEEGMVRFGADHSDGHLVSLVPAGVPVDYE